MGPQFSQLSYEDRLSRPHLTPLEGRRLQGDPIFTYLALHILGQHQIFISNASERLRGHNFKICKEFLLRQTFIMKRVFSVWNNLPSNIVNALSINVFKNR